MAPGGSASASCSSPARPAGSRRRVYQVSGVPVEFPYQPYGPQLALMGCVVATLDRARRHGRSHALFESPTDTGKSLALLCSTLAWQQKAAAGKSKAKGSAPPTIYYATRTHAQVTQVIREYRKTSYRVRMSVLERE